METRANYVWVGAISLLLLGLLAVFIVWLAQLGTADRKDYDIFFEQSVGGLANGSEVTFKGVPAGQVTQIELWRQNPEFVRVRVSLEDDIPILQGTTASISGFWRHSSICVTWPAGTPLKVTSEPLARPPTDCSKKMS